MFLIFSGILEGIGGFLGFILMGIVVFYLVTFVAKLFNTNVVSRSGNPIADPSSFDQINSGIKKRGQKLLKNIKRIDLNTYRILKSDNSNRIEKLQSLRELYNEGLITREEFEDLKTEVFQ